jgi:hypothetical protein
VIANYREHNGLHDLQYLVSQKLRRFLALAEARVTSMLAPPASDILRRSPGRSKKKTRYKNAVIYCLQIATLLPRHGDTDSVLRGYEVIEALSVLAYGELDAFDAPRKLVSARPVVR